MRRGCRAPRSRSIAGVAGLTGTDVAWPARAVAIASCRRRWLDRLDEEGADRLARPVVDAERGEHDDRRGRAAVGGAERRGQRDAVELGHVQVDDRDVEVLALRQPSPAPRGASRSPRPSSPSARGASGGSAGSWRCRRRRARAGRRDRAASRGAGRDPRSASAWNVRRNVLPLPAMPSLARSANRPSVRRSGG